MRILGQAPIILNYFSSKTSTNALLKVENLYKSFTLHSSQGVRLSVLEGISLSISAGECIALTGTSGSGKSSLIRCIYGNYRIDSGSVWVKHEGSWVDLPQLQPHELLAVRKKTIGYVSQFLRVIPRVPALQVAAEPLLELGVDMETAYERVRLLFYRLNLPERLWSLSPTTFSGGEKQRVNLARALCVKYPILLLDEPTSALDANNKQVVIELLEEYKAMGGAVISIFHDQRVCSLVSTREFNLTLKT